MAFILRYNNLEAMVIKKYKYYFKKPRSIIVKDVLSWLAMAGVVCIAVSSPYFVNNFLKNYQNFQKYKKRKITDTFYNLKRQGLIKIDERNHQIYIKLTEEGRKRAGWLQIDSLKINQPKKWDKKWRIVMFDISQLKKIYRETFRGKLKELGFSPFQKSVWVHPFDCRAEIALLKDFFGFSEKEIKLIITENIGKESESEFKKLWRLD